jgi:hypothetical protein
MEIKIMKWLSLCVLVLLVTGCAGLEVYDGTLSDEPDTEIARTPETRSKPTPPPSLKFTKKPLSNIDHVFLGMTKDEVLSVMGDDVTIGYHWNDELGTITPIIRDQPLRDDMVRLGNQEYEVIYYWVDVKQSDGHIKNNEMMPLVFDQTKLIGKGYDFLESLKLRFR